MANLLAQGDTASALSILAGTLGERPRLATVAEERQHDSRFEGMVHAG